MTNQPRVPPMPDHIDHTHLTQALALLLPNADLTRITAITIERHDVTVAQWYLSQQEYDPTEIRQHSTRIPIAHVQGSATEGGQQ